MTNQVKTWLLVIALAFGVVWGCHRLVLGLLATVEHRATEINRAQTVRGVL